MAAGTHSIGKAIVITHGSTVVANVKDVTQLCEAKMDFAETTILADDARTYLPVHYDGGSLKFSIVGDLDSTEYGAIATLFTGLTSATWKVAIGAVEKTFTGFVESITMPASKGDHNVFEVTVKVSGAAPL